MVRAFFAVGLALLCLTPLGNGAPVQGTSWSEKAVEGASADRPGVLAFDVAYNPGERACVVVIGDHDPVVDVEVKVYDSKRQLVVQDRGTPPAQDFVAVMWYPPRQATYHIEILNYGKAFNKCSVAIK
jgi:hypothetical protein